MLSRQLRESSLGYLFLEVWGHQWVEKAFWSCQDRKLHPSQWHGLTTRSHDQHSGCPSDPIEVHGEFCGVYNHQKFVDDLQITITCLLKTNSFVSDGQYYNWPCQILVTFFFRCFQRASISCEVADSNVWASMVWLTFITNGLSDCWYLGKHDWKA